MTRTIAIAACAAWLTLSAPTQAAEAPKPPAQEWSFEGLFGTVDQAAAQRGLQVYRQVCRGCHSLDFVAYRNLQEIGLSEDQVQAIAAEYEVETCCTEAGDKFTRPAKPSDPFVPPFPNPEAARAANNGALPPDLSLITEARKGGADYIYGVLIGYRDEPPEGVELMPGMSYNEYFPGHQIAMPPPLAEGAVDYADGTEATVAQQAHDVVAFLTWTAEPNLEARKRLGVKVLLFVIALTGMLYALKRKIWADVH